MASSRVWRAQEGLFEGGVRHLQESIHSLTDAVDELRRFEASRGVGPHFTQALSAVEKAEFQIAVAKRQLREFARDGGG